MSVPAFVDHAVTQCLAAPIRRGDRPSLYAGGLGVAYFLLEVYRLRRQEQLLERARLWWEASQSTKPLAPRTGEEWSFLQGSAGHAAMGTILAEHYHQPTWRARSLEAFALAWQRMRHFKPVPTDLYSGAAGMLIGACNLNRQLPNLPPSSRRRLLQVAASATNVVRRHVQQALKHWDRPAVPLGMGHGLAGELWALLQTGSANELVFRCWEQSINRYAEADKHIVIWPTLRGQSSTDHPLACGMFCGGWPGHILLCWALAARGYAKAARQLPKALTAMLEVGATNSSLCCGLAGQALVLKHCADLLDSQRHRRRASSMLNQAAAMAEQESSESPDRLAGNLWQGPLGVALVCLRYRAKQFSFPLIELVPH